MGKIILLTGSHFRKNRGTSVGLFLLMTLAAMLISIAMLLFFDAHPTPVKEAKRLDAGDGYIRISKSVADIDDALIDDSMNKDTEWYEITHCLTYDAVSLPFGNGELSMNLLVEDREALNRQRARLEIVTEDEQITGSYIYLPYQFYTSGGYQTGDSYQIELLGKTYTYTVKGFLNTTYFGCNNTGCFEFIVDDASYQSMMDKDLNTAEGIVVVYQLKEGVKQSAFQIRISNDILKVNDSAVVNMAVLSDVTSGRSFMSLIIAVSFLTVTVIILLVIVLMLVNAISNYIKENMKTIGALKAIGYTSRDIKLSLLVMFVALALVGSVLGVALSYVIMPFMSSFVVGQMGIPYTVSFHAGSTVIALAAVIVYTIFATLISLRKIRRIDPIIALRDGIEGHNFKKNRIRLDKSVFGLNVSLALKTMLMNKKQNIITFFVTGVIVFVCVIGLLMYENFNRNPKLSMLTFEICGGIVVFDYETKEEALDYLESRNDISNIRNSIVLLLYYQDEDALSTYVFDDVSKMNNKNICYEGRLPEYDNEIAVSGKFAKDYGMQVGDEITMDYGEKSYTYLITGLIQTTNNNGREGVMNESAAEHLLDLTYAPAYYWYDCDDKETSAQILSDCTEKYGSHVLSTMNFYEIMEGSMTSFKSLASLMLVLVCGISAVVILLVLYLLIRSFIFSKRRDYGIYKALGYTSNSLMLQTALSFMPSIILSVIIFSFVSYYMANPYMNIIMQNFGIVKCDFGIPVSGVVIIGAAIVLLAFAFAFFEARRIKKIEAYQMLIGE